MAAAEEERHRLDNERDHRKLLLENIWYVVHRVREL